MKKHRLRGVVRPHPCIERYDSDLKRGNVHYALLVSRPLLLFVQLSIFVGNNAHCDGAGDGVAGRERVPQFWAGHVVSAGDRLRAAVLVQKKSACPARL